MKKISTLLRRYFILNKRLFRKASFVVILLLVPVLVGAMAIVSRNSESGMLTVALAMQDNSDTIANDIITELSDNRGLILFERFETVKEASEAVEKGRADAAWIFSNDMDRKIKKFAAHTHPNNAFVVIIQREDNVLLRLSHEKLNTVLYPYISVALCGNYIYDHVLTLDDLPEEKLKEYYYSVNAEGEDLFEFVHMGDDTPVDVRESNYLTSPLRGLLAIMVVLSGFAVAMFYMQDEARGTFDRIPYRRRFVFSLSYHATAVVSTATVTFISLLLVGMAEFSLREITALLLYCLITVGFCMGARLLLRDIRILGVSTPVLVVAMTVLCPVFFNFAKIPAVQFLLPPYYYLNAIYSTKFILYMIIYALAVYGVDYALYRLQRK